MRDFLLNLIPFYGFITNNFLNAFLSTGIFIFALLEISRFNAITKQIEANLNDVIMKLKKTEKNFQTIKSIFEKNELLKLGWYLYEKTLVAKEQNGKIYYYKTEEAEKFFDEFTILNRKMNIRYWFALPGIFVGLGIFGTFIGLTYGISNFNIKDIDSVKYGIENMLRGTGTAFLTSVWGLFFSIFFNWYEKNKFNRLSICIYNMNVYINSIFTLPTSQKVLFEQKELSTKIDFFMEKFINELVDKFSNILENMISKKLDNIDEKTFNIKNSLLDVILRIDSMFAKLEISIDKLREEKQKSIIDGISNVVEEFRKALLEDTKKDFENLSNILGETINKINNLPSIINDIEQTLQNSNNQFEEIFNNQRESLEEVNEKINANIDETMKLIKNNILESIQVAANKIQELQNIEINHIEFYKKLLFESQDLTNKYNDSIGKFNELITKIEESFRSIDDGFVKNQNLINKVVESIDTIDSTLKSLLILNNAFKVFAKDIEKGLEGYNNTVRQSINNYLTDFSNHLTKSVEILSSGIDELGEKMEYLNDTFEVLINQVNKKNNDK